VAQLSDDCFALGGPLMSADEALGRLKERLTVVAEPEAVALKDACGRILAEDVVAPLSVPPHDNVAVDGYAVFFDDLAADRETRLAVAGRAAAGHPFASRPRRGEAVRVFTGAPMPEGVDTVLMQEDCRLDDGAVIVPPGIKRGANRRRAGEDVAAGSTILSAGRRLRPQDVGLAASIGRTELRVYRPLRVALLSTGDEIRDVGEALPAGCVYDANRYALAGLLDRLGCRVDDLGIVPDRRAALRDALDGAAATHDVLVSSGGVSTGEEDHVRAVVDELGSLHFWRLAVRPGRPIALGQIRRVPFIALPGNPVAVMVTFMRFARPAILLMAGCRDIEPRTFPVRAAFDFRKKLGRREWLRVRLFTDGDGALAARKFPREGAGILTSMVEADGLVELPEELTAVAPGMMVQYLPFSEVA
jgi:molybdopterin molybdotransferase